MAAPRNSRPTALTPLRCVSPLVLRGRAPRFRHPLRWLPHRPSFAARGPALADAARRAPAPARAPRHPAQVRPVAAQRKRADLASPQRRPRAPKGQDLPWAGARALSAAAGRWPLWQAFGFLALRCAPRPLCRFRPAPQTQEPVRAQAGAPAPPTAWPGAAPAMEPAGRTGAPASATAPPARRHAASVTQPQPRPGAGVPGQRTPVYCCGEPLARPAGGAAPSSGIQASRSPGWHCR